MMHAILNAIIAWVLLSVGITGSIYGLTLLERTVYARRAQRRAERAAWEKLRREEREAERRWKLLMRDMRGRRVKPSPIAISFHPFDDELAALKLIDRIAGLSEERH